MSTVDSTSNGGDRRQQLERRAAVVRARIEERLLVLERRRDGLMNRLQSFTKPPFTTAAAFLLIGAVGAAWVVHQTRRAPRRLLASRFARPPRRGWFIRALEKAAIALGTAMLRRLASRGFYRWLDPGASVPRLPASSGVSASHLR